MSLPASLANRLELPVVGSPLFIVSGPELVIAQCKAGIVGSFPALNARPVEKLDEWLTQIENELGEYQAKHPEKKVAPYAVNQICHASNDRLMHDMETCVKHKVPIIITSLRPPSEIVEAAHSYGGVVFHDVINVKHARKAAEQGVDGLILVCAGAGGHAGTLSPFRAGARGQAVVQGHDPAVGRDLRRLEHRIGARARRRPRLCGHPLHRDRGSQCRH
ncbi:NAD(P)H-dependent flavin oxidoreductase YrpB (nitropropane dioxygenase family) [Bradyrhizobium sp. JR6.1]